MKLSSLRSAEVSPQKITFIKQKRDYLSEASKFVLNSLFRPNFIGSAALEAKKGRGDRASASRWGEALGVLLEIGLPI